MEPGPVDGGWRVRGLRGVRETAFRLTKQGGRVVVEARSESSMAALVFELEPAGVQYSKISWQWRIANHLRSADIHTREGDDYPARLYVIFDDDPKQLSLLARIRLEVASAIHGSSLPSRALCYVWDRDAAMETSVPSAFTAGVQMIVVRSGGVAPAEWTAQTRDFRADYRRAFGAEAPPVSGVAIASDSDNTRESALAWFGDVILSGRVEPR
ncbi:MAG: DUF3047 domain-containing protein [Deltaproteobacteria bacterium]|nr:DUF3047 domain-containing protein [Deltaproteobacteria bacterium]MBW2417915.1 DUF3047 domain-containing protein [Deltaproteobacteria bacterium]